MTLHIFHVLPDFSTHYMIFPHHYPCQVPLSTCWKHSLCQIMFLGLYTCQIPFWTTVSSFLHSFELYPLFFIPFFFSSLLLFHLYLCFLNYQICKFTFSQMIILLWSSIITLCNSQVSLRIISILLLISTFLIFTRLPCFFYSSEQQL